jgi:hypothetical protein
VDGLMPALISVKQFAKAPSYGTWLYYVIEQQRLYINHPGGQVAVDALSGGGRTTGYYEAERAKTFTKIPVSTGRAVSDFTQKASPVKDLVVHRKEGDKGTTRRVSEVRGGPLPPGTWLAVPLGHPDFRKPTAKLSAIFHLNPILYQQAVPYKFERDWDTFYIHPAGALGSDGCIVMAPDERKTLLKYCKENRPYVLKAVVSFNERDMIGARDLTSALLPSFF